MQDPNDEAFGQPPTDGATTAASSTATEQPPELPPATATRRRKTTPKRKSRARRKAAARNAAPPRAKSTGRVRAASKQPRNSGRVIRRTPELGESPETAISSMTDLTEWLDRRRGRR